jgi:chitinase
LIDNGYTYRWDAETLTPTIYSPSRFNGHFISYEDARSLGFKADFVKQRGLGGMMVWELSNDARSGTTLLEVIDQRLR